MRSALTSSVFLGKRRLRFESLENRLLLAGNVTAACSKGVLTICGDKYDNSICVRQIDDCRWEISGLNGTKINGKDCCIVKDVKCITIDCKAGCDTIKVCDGILKDCLKICDSKGDTRVICSNLCVGGLSVATGGGKDCCYITCCEIKCEPKCSGKTAANGVKWNTCCINTGSGCDDVLLSKVCGASCTMDIKCGGGADRCYISECQVKTLICDSGSGKECDKVALNGCRAERCDIKCDKTDYLACRENNFGKQSCKVPYQSVVDQCLKEICDSREWKDWCRYENAA